MADYITNDTDLTAVADAIRTKGGTSAPLEYPNGFVTAIGNISGGGGTDTSDATLTSGAQMLSPYTAYSKGTKYTGSIQTKTSSDLQASGATVTVPSGYYASQSTKSVSSGSATAPSTISGTGATASGSSTTLTLSKTVSVTPSVTAGYVSSGTAGNSSVSLSATDSNWIASNIKSGVSIFGKTGSYTGGGGGGLPSTITAGDQPVLINPTLGKRTGNSLADISVSLTIKKAGTYRFKWVAFRQNTSSQYTNSTRLYKNGNAVGTEITSWTDTYYQVNSLDLACAKDDVIKVYARSRGSSYAVFAGFLTACINWTIDWS